MCIYLGVGPTEHKRTYFRAGVLASIWAQVRVFGLNSNSLGLSPNFQTLSLSLMSFALPLPPWLGTWDSNPNT